MKPMLAATCTSRANLRFPLLASPKLDGIRATVLDNKLLSRSLKPIRNAYVYTKFSKPAFDGLDGELVDGDHDAGVFLRTTSAVSRATGTPAEVKFWVFDVYIPGMPFDERQKYLKNRNWDDGIKLVPQVWVHSEHELNMLEEKWINEGYEGVMLRHPKGPYKLGRSTEREGWLIKLKEFDYDYAEIIGVEERMHNGNAAITNALGHTERSSHQANLVGRGDLGALVVRGINGKYEGIEFKIGSGFDDGERQLLWNMGLVGRTVKYRFFPMGSKDKPRFPTWRGFEDLPATL